jgi:hypothetical protein
VRRVDQRRGTTLILSSVIIVVGPALTWLVVHGDERDARVFGAVGLALTFSVAVAGLVERELAWRRDNADTPPTPEGLTAELLERWRVALVADVIRIRVGAGGQLDMRVSEGDPIDANARRVDHDSGRPRVRVGGRLLAWSEIIARWDTTRSRLVILGDPGYGKTVAALTLVKHINAHDAPGASVAELFSLADWQRWRGDHPDAPLGEWLAEQLTVAHPSVPVAVARQLVDARLIVPVLDGLDEIATVERRRACVAAIDAYAERGEPHRPFVLTCRAREYRELAPDWVRDDECIVLVGLQPDQIKQHLHEQTAGRAAWDVVRQRQAAGDAALNTLLASPLRLAIALRVYRDHDPGELLELDGEQARQRLWELLLITSAGYRSATPAQVRAWLTWLACGMRRTGRQRLMLHELSLLHPHSAKNFRMFRAVLAIASALAIGLAGSLISELYNTWFSSRSIVSDGIFDWPYGLGFGLVGGLLVGLSTWLVVESRPSVRTRVSWRGRLLSAPRRKVLIRRLALGLISALVSGLSVGLIVELRIGLLVGFTSGVGILLLSIALAGTDVIAADPPLRFAYTGPDAVLDASRSSGLAGAVAGALAGGLAGALAGGLFGRIDVGLYDWLADALYTGLAFGLAFGLIGGLAGGLDAWLYHYWLRWRLRRRRLLPVRLPSFLDWCARDERGWLRISDAYEFRHRELLEHLAPATTIIDSPNNSHIGEEDFPG